LTTIVWGHGSRSRGAEKTFVPDGTTIKWYADLDQNLLTRNGFLALSSGDFGAPTDSQGPGSGTSVEVFNYEVFEDLAKRDQVAILHRGDSDLKFVGAEVPQGPLCSTPAECRKAGKHDCGGLLGTVHDTEIVILVCRGLPGGNTATAAFGSDPVTKDIDEDFQRWFQTWVTALQTDPDSAMREFETYSDPVKLQLGTFIAVPVWQAVHWASTYAAAGQYTDAFTQFRSVTDAGALGWMLGNIPVYAARFTDAANADPEAFFAALDAGPQIARDAFNALPAIATAREAHKQAGAQAAFEDFAAGSWAPTAEEIAGVNEINRATVKAADDGEALPYIVAGFVLLIGDGHGGEWQSWAANEPDQASGTITVKRATFGAGRLDVEGCPPSKQSIVENAIGSFSDKEVRFV
jgi:hypothetical protein